MKVKGVVPESPSWADTSLMLMRGSSSTMVTTAWPSAIFAPFAPLKVDEEVLVGLQRVGRRHGDQDRLAGLAGGKGQLAG